MAKIIRGYEVIEDWSEQALKSGVPPDAMRRAAVDFFKHLRNAEYTERSSARNLLVTIDYLLFRNGLTKWHLRDAKRLDPLKMRDLVEMVTGWSKNSVNMAAWLGLLQGGKHLFSMETNLTYSGAFVGGHNNPRQACKKINALKIDYDLTNLLYARESD